MSQSTKQSINCTSDIALYFIFSMYIGWSVGNVAWWLPAIFNFKFHSIVLTLIFLVRK